MSRRPRTIRSPSTRCMPVLGAVALCVFTFATPSFAHVALDTPKSGLTLAVGSTVQVTWEDTILHDGIGYDLDLIDADERVYSSIVHELPTTLHSYDWLVPDVWCVGCYLMVTQVNRDHDYYDSVLVNIYGTPAAAGGSSGMGGAVNHTQGGATDVPGGSGGGAGSQASLGIGGTLSFADAGSAGASDSSDSTMIDSNAGTSGSGKGKPVVSGAAGTAPVSAGGSSAAGEATTDAGGEPAADASRASSDSAGCAVDSRGSSPRGVGLSVALLSLVLAARKWRRARRA